MKSIRSQLTRRLVVGTLVIAGCGGTAAYLTVRTAVLHQFDDALLAKARAISALTSQGRGGRPHLDASNVPSLGFPEDGNEHFFQLRRADGNIIGRSPARAADPLSWPAHPGDTPAFSNIDLPGDIDGRAVAFTFVPGVDEDDEDDEKPRDAPSAEPVEILVASTREPLDATLRTILAALGLSTGVLLASAVIFVPRLLRRELHPLDKLADQVRGITAESLATRFAEAEAPAEIAPVVHRLNDLLGRIEESFERERRFSADLAHELRTPLAELRSQAELAIKWPDARSPGADDDTLAIALRMEHLVTRLLALARAEGGQAGAIHERILVSHAIQAAWGPFAEQAADRRLRVNFQIQQELAITSDPALLREILTNLFSNAVDYSSEGGLLQISADLTSGVLSLRVTNPVHGLTHEDIGKIFDRFWRKEASRTDDRHAGLGLALALCYAETLQYSLTAALDEDGSHLTFALNGEDPPFSDQAEESNSPGSSV